MDIDDLLKRVDDLGKVITIRSGNFVSISGWRDIQINKIL